MNRSEVRGWTRVVVALLVVACFAGSLALADRSAKGRDPFPEPGEQIDKPIAPTRLADDDAPKAETKPAPAKGEVVPWHEAQNHVGRKITVEGVIVHARNTGKVCFLNFSKEWKGKFYVIIFEDALNAWGEPPEKHFLNKKVHVTGVVKERSGTPQIQVNQGSQITIAPESDKPAADKSQD